MLSGLAYLVSCFPYHVPPARVLVCFPFRFTCFSYLYEYELSTRLQLLVCFTFLLLCCRLVHLRFLFMPLSFRLVDSSMLTITDFAYLFWSVDSSPGSLFLDYDSCFPFVVLCTCISQSTIYMGWRWGSIPHLQSTLQPP